MDQFNSFSWSSLSSWIVQVSQGHFLSQSGVSLLPNAMQEKCCSLMGLLLLSFLPVMEWSLLKMGLNRCWSTAVERPLLIQKFSCRCCHMELQHDSSTHVTFPHSPLLSDAWTPCCSMSRGNSRNSSCDTFSWQNLWPFYGTLVFGLRPCFSQGKFILLASSMDPTAQPYSVPLWFTLNQLDSSTLNFEKVQ